MKAGTIQGRVEVIVVSVRPVHQVRKQVAHGVFKVCPREYHELCQRGTGPGRPVVVLAIGIGWQGWASTDRAVCRASVVGFLRIDVVVDPLLNGGFSSL